MWLEICGESIVPYPFYPDFPTISNGATLHYLRNDARPAVIIQEAGYENSNRKRGGSIRRIRFEIPDSIVWQNLCDPYSILSPFFSPLYRHISRFLSSLPDPRHLQTASPKSVPNRSIQILVSPRPYRFERSVHRRIQNSNKLCSQYRAKKTEARNSIPVVKISVPRRITRRLTVVTVGQEARLGEERYHPPFHGSFCEK